MIDESIPVDGGWQVALRNLNDNSVEGLWHDTLPVLSVQFHPEASPGPSDSNGMFDQFLDLIQSRSAAD